MARTGGPHKQFVSAEKQRLAKERMIKGINNAGFYNAKAARFAFGVSEAHTHTLWFVNN